jgi:hypothetical protein
MTLPRLCQALVIICLLATAPGVRAQALLDTQMELNSKALDAATEGDHATAVRLLRSSLELGELNVTWLNLGRVHQLAGACQEARQAFDRVPAAPAVAEPPRSRVLSARDRYVRELQASCGGILIVKCSPPALQIDVGGKRIRCEQPTNLVAGSWRVAGRLNGKTVERQVVVAPGQEIVLELGLDRPAVSDTGSDDTPINGWFVAGWTSAGVSLISGIAAAVVYVDLAEDLDELSVISATPGGDRARYDQVSARVEGGTTVFYLMLGLSAASAVGSGLSFYAGWPDDPVTVTLAPFGASVSYRF